MHSANKWIPFFLESQLNVSEVFNICYLFQEPLHLLRCLRKFISLFVNRFCIPFTDTTNARMENGTNKSSMDFVPTKNESKRISFLKFALIRLTVVFLFTWMIYLYTIVLEKRWIDINKIIIHKRCINIMDLIIIFKTSSPFVLSIINQISLSCKWLK